MPHRTTWVGHTVQPVDPPVGSEVTERYRTERNTAPSPSTPAGCTCGTSFSIRPHLTGSRLFAGWPPLPSMLQARRDDTAPPGVVPPARAGPAPHEATSVGERRTAWTPRRGSRATGLALDRDSGDLARLFAPGSQRACAQRLGSDLRPEKTRAIQRACSSATGNCGPATEQSPTNASPGTSAWKTWR